jgi:hypothetical protein
LPAAGKDCAIAGLYSVREEPRCPDTCGSGSRTMNPVNVTLNIDQVTFAFDNQDNRAEHVNINGTCKLSGCDCTNANGLHVVFGQTEWFADGLPEAVTSSAPGQSGTCVGRAYHHGTRNP